MDPLHSNQVHLMLLDPHPTSSDSASLLTQSSFKVTTCKMQQDALALLEEHKGEFSMVITSDQTQEMDCPSFIQRIRLIQEDLPIIVISSSETESNADEGLKTQSDSACYVIKMPVSASNIWSVWRQHQMTRSTQVCGGNGSVDPKGKASADKRSNPCEEDGEVARKKGKGIAEPSNTKSKSKTNANTGMRPSFDPEQHKILMKAITYPAPAKNINTAQCFPMTRIGMGMRMGMGMGMGQQKVPPMPQRQGRARAPWSQQLNERLDKLRARNTLPGYGVQQPNIYQMMMDGRFPPSWVSPMGWRARLASEYLNGTSDGAMGGFALPTPINGGLNAVGHQRPQMPRNPNMVTINGLSSPIQPMLNQVGTQSNPIVIDGTDNGSQAGMSFGSYGPRHNMFQSTNNVLPIDSQTTAYNGSDVEMGENLNREEVNEENVVTWQDLGTTPPNDVETFVNEASKQGAEGDGAENMDPGVDELAELFSFLENGGDEGVINSLPNEANEVEGEIYFDIDNFELSFGDPQI